MSNAAVPYGPQPVEPPPTVLVEVKLDQVDSRLQVSNHGTCPLRIHTEASKPGDGITVRPQGHYHGSTRGIFLTPVLPEVAAPLEVAPNLPPAVHQLKSHTDGFEPVWSGLKTHELRNDDRGFRVADLLILREFVVYTGPLISATAAEGVEIEVEYTGRYIAAEVTHVTRCDRWMGANGTGYVVLSLKVWSRATNSDLSGKGA